MTRPRRGRPSRAGTLLVLTGLLSVLGATFAAGFYAGRVWPRPVPAAEATSRAEARAARDGRERSRAADGPPSLTFYRELTAPLTAPPPAKPSRPGRSPESPRREPPASAREARGPASAGVGDDGPARASGVETEPGVVRYTVQVGAYKARPTAEALRATLSAAGHDAHVEETSAPAGVRYRVRVGSFATREAARAAATRLSSERTLPAFITTR